VFGTARKRNRRWVVSGKNPNGDIEDSLDHELAVIEGWLTENALKQVAAWIKPGDGVLTIQWSSAPDDSLPDWRSFLTQAKTLRAPFVAMMVQRLTKEEWGDENELALQSAAESGEPAEIPLWLEECRAHIGQVGAIELKWLAPEYAGVVFALGMFAPWFDRFYDREEEDSDSKAGSTKRKLSDAEVQRLAGKVARSPEYERATDYRQREEIVRAVLPSDATPDEDQLYQVMSAATDIFEDEILPKVEKSPEIRDLAIKLANDTRFQRASNQGARRYAAEQILPAEVLEHGTKLKLVLERAKTIYDVDLRKGKSAHH